MSTSLAVAAPQVDQEAILRALSLNPADPKTQALVLTCARYGLDPLLKHAVLIQGALYVTRDGLLHVAHESGRFDGLEVEQLPETPSHYVAVARVWRKDMGRPFTFQGRYPKAGKSGPGASHGPEMAEKVAVCRALRHAFDVALCSREEAWEEEPQPIRHRPETPAPHPGGPGQEGKALWDAMREFAAAASKAGEDVTDPKTGKPSRSLMEQIAASVMGGAVPTTASEWGVAADALRDRGEGVGEDLVAEVVDSELAQIADPFGEGE